MKTVRFIIVIALTLAAILAILSPTMLAQALPPTVTEMLRLEDFPLLGSCTKIASQLMSALHGGNKPTIEIVTSSIGEGFMDELLSLLMVAVLSIPVSLILAFLLYRPLAENGWKLPLYASLYLCSMILAWALYRKVYFAGLIEGLIKDNISDLTLQTIVNYLTQLLSVAAIGAIALRIAAGLLAAKLVIGHVIVPALLALLRAILFAFILALLYLWQAQPSVWQTALPLIAGAVLVSVLTDQGFFRK